jgi:hypothetical protein
MDCKVAKNLLLISFTAETFFAGYGLLSAGQTALTSILYFVAGLILVLSLLFVPEATLNIRDRSGFRIVGIKLALTGGMIFLAYITSRYWLFRIPIDPDYADMLPVIKVMNERFLSGHWKQVYDPIAEIWNGTRPIYLPAMWLPYSSTILMKMDMRWMTVLCILLSFGSFLWVLRLSKNSFYSYLLMAVAAMFFWWIFSRDDVHGLISLSEEGPVILYYVLLCFAIVSGNIYFIGIAASLCLLSRYSGIGWILPFLLLLIAGKKYKKTVLFALTGMLFFLLFFLIPFGFSPVRQLIQLPSGYVSFAQRVWADSPETFWLNLGLAKFFGPHHAAALHATLLLGSFILPVVFVSVCLLQKKWRLHNVSLATLKLTLIIFYQFIDVPYGYLFYTSSFVSLTIAGILSRKLSAVNHPLSTIGSSSKT